MEVILLQDVKALGKKGQKVNVSEGYARNFILPKKLGIEGNVIRTGIVVDDELVDFYNLADLFVFPSLYEGFGIPPLEAMACGTPVVCSDNSSLPEVVGDAAYTFNPYDTELIREAMEKVLSDEALAASLIEKGYERVKMFTPESVINRTKAAFERIKG